MLDCGGTCGNEKFPSGPYAYLQSMCSRLRSPLFMLISATPTPFKCGLSAGMGYNARQRSPCIQVDAVVTKPFGSVRVVTTTTCATA
eukprot:9471559-Pyramimonas_sp.AAC.2